MADWQEWSHWLIEGYYISYLREGTRYYEHIIARDLAHYLYDWPETINAGAVSGPFVPADLEVTKGYDSQKNLNQIWQMIFGIKGEVYIYIELPTDIHRHGLPKVPKPGTNLREISHFEEYISPYHEPTFLTEHFMMRPETDRIGFDAYNPKTVNLTDVALNVFIAKLETERIGVEEAGELTPTRERWSETLDRLYRRIIPHRPITLLPVRAPAEAVAGE